jgi:hypothetical protein
LSLFGINYYPHLEESALSQEALAIESKYPTDVGERAVEKSRQFRINTKAVMIFCAFILLIAGIKSCRSKKRSNNTKAAAPAAAAAPASTESATATESATSNTSPLIMSLSSGAECQLSTKARNDVLAFLDANDSFESSREPRPKEGAYKAVLARIKENGATSFEVCPDKAEEWLMRSLKLEMLSNGNADQGTDEEVRYGRSVGFILVNCHDRAEGAKAIGMGVLGWEFASPKGLNCQK